jgi:hypothetical protein
VRFLTSVLIRSTVNLNLNDGRPEMGTKVRIGQLFSRGVERRGDDYIVSYEDDTGSHERAFGSRREAKRFRTTLGMSGKPRDPAAYSLFQATNEGDRGRDAGT